MQLEPQTRQFLNLCVARARAYERQQLAAEAEALRAEIAAERDAMHAKLAELKASIIGEYVEMRDELATLRECYAAHRAHVIAKQEVGAIYRRHTIERAMEAVRDPTAPLQ